MPEQTKDPKPQDKSEKTAEKNPPQELPEKEIGGQDGPEPTRYGDWEKAGIISDF